MTVINKVPENLEADCAVIYNARRISNLQGHAICFAYSTAKRTLLADALGPNRKLISCSLIFKGRKLDFKINFISIVSLKHT